MAENISDMQFEIERRLLAEKRVDELQIIVADQFDEAYPSEGLYSGSFPDRVRQFVLNRVKAVCDSAGELGGRVWAALNDDHTAHNVERFALVCDWGS